MKKVLWWLHQCDAPNKGTIVMVYEDADAEVILDTLKEAAMEHFGLDDDMVGQGFIKSVEFADESRPTATANAMPSYGKFCVAYLSTPGDGLVAISNILA